MSYNPFIGNAPVLIALLIIAALSLVTWYRPPAHTLGGSANTGQISESLRAAAPQGASKRSQ